MNEQTDPLTVESTEQGHRRRFRALHFILVSILTLVLIFFAYLAYLTVSLPAVDALRENNPDATSLMRERWNEAREAREKPKRIQQWVSLDDVSERIVQAVVMGEDASFYSHHGFDFYEIKESIRKNIERGRFARGASTITQQLAKNLFLSTERSLSRKLKEAILTYRLEQDLSKDRILEIYLNVIEWGESIYGVEAAARIYFGKRASQLDAAESALLAAMIPNPRRLHPSKNMDALKVRQERILGWMKMAGYLSDDECEAAKRQILRLKVPVNGKQ
jgi:monofunctional biosynthetic peptidoglycan transglycosylase